MIIHYILNYRSRVLCTGSIQNIVMIIHYILNYSSCVFCTGSIQNIVMIIHYILNYRSRVFCTGSIQNRVLINDDGTQRRLNNIILGMSNYILYKYTGSRMKMGNVF